MSDHLRGHLMYFDGHQYRYVDTDTPTVGAHRPCGHCGLEDTPEGHDACLGTLPGVTNACCGHGSSAESYIIFDNGIVVRGFDRVEKMT